MMQQHEQNDDLAGFCPSFNCYFSDSLASTAAAEISTQLQQQAVPLHDDDFEFPLNELSSENVISDDRTFFPLFNRDLLTQNQVNHEQKADCTDSLANLFISERAESVSSSSEESEGEEASVVSCVWRHKTNTSNSSPLSKCKKSSSTGSGSKRWRIRDLLRRSNSEGKEPMMLLSNNNNRKKLDEVSKLKQSSGEVAVVSAGRSKPSVHQLFYKQQRAKRDGGKRKSYLPYRQGLVGLFSSNVNGKGNKFPFL